jgi:hypothetical protein
MTTIDNKSGNLATAEEARIHINGIIEQYRALIKDINAAIDAHEAEILALKEQKQRLVSLIPNNQPIR